MEGKKSNAANILMSHIVGHISISVSACRYFAVTHGRRVQMWNAPGHSVDFAPFSLYQTLPGQYDDALCLDWSDDSK